MRTILLAFAALAGLTACSKSDTAADTTAASTVTPAPADSAAPAGTTVAMRDAAGRDLGTITLSDVSGGIMVMGTLRGIAPGDHGIHLHMTGSCEPTFDAAGGHWNPTSKDHGTGNAKGPHLGDLVNITVAADSSVSIHLTSPGGTLKGENMLLDADGAAVVVHATADDYKTNPSGNSGNRVACGAVKGG
ncbi:MAG: superoxide dismutase family protein [Gemmatimonadaceae bacterium]